MRSLLFLTAFLASSLGLYAGESMLTTTYQPLNGLGGGGIRIVPVACHDWYRSSGMQTQISLISAKNVPPTNNAKETIQDLNLASVYGVRFSGDPANVNGKGRDLSVYAPGWELQIHPAILRNRFSVLPWSACALPFRLSCEEKLSP